MNKVTTINLNGNAFQLEDVGCIALTAYLQSAKDRLFDNPDLLEIMADLEQAIAEKFRRFLSAHKTVVTTDEVTTVIAEMGPVGADSVNENGEEPAARGPRRLYRIAEGEYIAGVATGLAAYLNIDVKLVRILMIVLLVLTSGGFFFAYVLAWIFIPAAQTPEERAKARGAPFNAEEIIARAKAEYTKFGSKSSEWKSQWSDSRNEKKRSTLCRKEWQRRDWNNYPRHHSFFGELVGTIGFVFVIWVGYHHVPVIHQFLDATWNLWHRTSDQIVQFVISQDK